MSVEEVEQAVSEFTPEELTSFRKWFADYDMAHWDNQIEADSEAGRLDHLIGEIEIDIEKGSVRPLNEIMDHQ